MMGNKCIGVFDAAQKQDRSYNVNYFCSFNCCLKHPVTSMHQRATRIYFSRLIQETGMTGF